MFSAFANETIWLVSPSIPAELSQPGMSGGTEDGGALPPRCSDTEHDIKLMLEEGLQRGGEMTAGPVLMSVKRSLQVSVDVSFHTTWELKFQECIVFDAVCA